MPARFLSGLAAGVVLLAAAGTALSANTVRIQSKDVSADIGSVAVGVYITNDRDATTIVLPLELRAVTPGAPFIDAFDLTVGGRIANSGLRDLEVLRLCGTASPDNRCSGPTSHTWSCPEQAEVPSEFFTSPSAVMWVGVCLTGPSLPLGIDPPGEPSITLTFGIPYALGRFEIDTCCMTPANRLAFGIIPGLGEPSVTVVPNFTRGVITIEPPAGTHPPVALCRDITVSLRGGQTVPITAQDIDGGSYDRDDDSLSYTLTPTGPFPAGEHDIRFVVNDGLLADTCTATVTVVTNQPPVALCRDFRLDPGQRCDRFITSADIDAGSYDPDGDPITVSLTPDGAYPVGATPARLIVSDALFADTCEAVVTVDANAVLPFACPAAVGPDFDDHLQPRIPDMSPWIALCPGADEMTFNQSPPAGWFLDPGLDTITVSGATPGGRTFFCRVPIESPDEGPVGGPPLPLSAVTVEVMPDACPNILTIDCEAAYPPPLVIVIPGSDDFYALSIKPQTARVCGVPLDLWYVNDVAAPVRRHPDRLCACNETGGDGYPDIVIEFDACAVIAATGADTAREAVTLVLTAELTDGGSVTGGDCFKLYRPGDDPDSSGQLPGAILPLENYPNPFNSGTVIHYSLGQGGPVLLEVFNILGQRVRTLSTGLREPGPHQLSWNGRDDSGRPLASGLYLCRLSAPDRRDVRKMILLR